MKPFLKLLDFYLELVKIIPGEIPIFLGLFLQQFSGVIRSLVDMNSLPGMIISMSYDAIASYYIAAGVILYFTRFYLKRKAKLQKTK